MKSTFPVSFSTHRSFFFGPRQRLAIIASGLIFCASTYVAQSAPRPMAEPQASATITFADGDSIKIHGRERFQLVGIFPGETVTVRLELPARLANLTAAVQALDGGAVSGDVVLDAYGHASFAFRVGIQPGLYRVLLRARGKTAIIQFWVPDYENPEANPPVLTPSP